MINTIFYFIDHLPFDEYVSKINSGDIAEHTIVFVDDTKAIYKGGLWFGSTSDPDNIETIIELIRENAYVLPVASSLTLGGIRVGEHLGINNEGTLNVDAESLPKYNDTAIKNRLTNIEGIIGSIPSGQDDTLSDRLLSVENAVGNIKEVTASPILNNGVKIATITVGNVSSDIYAPAATQLPEPGSPNDPYSYDDSQLRQWLQDLEDEIDGARLALQAAIDELQDDLDQMSTIAANEKTRLDGVINGLNTSIELRIRQLFADAQWVQTYFPDTGNGSGGGSVSNFGTQDVETYLQLIGVWARDNDITKTQWSSIVQRVGSVEMSVSQLQQNSGSSGSGPTTEEWQAYVRTYVDGQIAGIENGSVYARTNDIDDIIEWLYSGLKAESSPSLTYSQLVSAAQNNQLGNTAIAGLWTEIQSIENNYVATTQLSTSVNDAIASIVQQAKPGSSFTSIINQVDTNKNNISSINSSITQLQNGILSESYLLNSVQNEIDGTTSQSQIKSKVDSEARSAAATMAAAVLNASGLITAESIATAIADSSSARTTLSAYFGSGGSGSADPNQVETIVTTKLNASVSGGDWSSWVNTISGDASAISALSARVTTLEGSGFVTETNLGTKIENINKGTGVWAGLVTSAKLTNDIASATTTLQAAIDGKVDSSSASIILAVNGSGGSSAKISADKIDITGTAVFSAINGANGSTTTIDGGKITANSITADKIKVSEIVAAINNSTGSSKLTIDADNVNITGSTVIGLINGGTSNTTTIEGSKIKTGSITATQIDATNLQVAAANITGTLSASQINTTGLSVAAANVTGTLTASQIDSSSLHVNAANIDGTLTVSAANVTGLTSAIQGTTISGNNITTGTISASRIDAAGVITAAEGNINSLITSTLTGGTATFTGTVNATSFLAGDPSGLNITTTANRINFNYGGNARAYFTTDSSGMQLYMLSSNGDWYSVDFTKWTNVSGGGGAYPAYNLTLYKLQDTDGSTSVVSQTKTIYYEAILSGSRFGHCYTDEYGTTLASNSNVGTGWYLMQGTNENILVDYLNGVSHAYAPSYGNVKLYPISFDSSGIMSCDTTTAIYADVGDTQTSSIEVGAVATVSSPTTCVRYIVGSASSTTEANKNNIYLDHNHQTSASNRLYPVQDTYNVYVCTYSNTLGSLGHYTTIDYDSTNRTYILTNY